MQEKRKGGGAGSPSLFRMKVSESLAALSRTQVATEHAPAAAELQQFVSLAALSRTQGLV
jgi:hypothetical protein